MVPITGSGMHLTVSNLMRSQISAPRCSNRGTRRHISVTNDTSLARARYAMAF